MDNASDNVVLGKWAEVKALVDSIELDVHKNAKGVAAAGTRVRKGLRDLKKVASELVKTTLETDKAKKAAKPKKEKAPKAQ
jgi:hypothetical protein